MSGDLTFDIADRLRAIAAPIFAATEDISGLTVHVAAVAGRASAKRQIVEALGSSTTRARVRFYRPSLLQAPRSLERLVGRFGDSALVYDPTGAITRGKTLVRAARTTREALGSRLCGLYYAPRSRTIFVALDAARVAAGDKFKVGALADIERAVCASQTAGERAGKALRAVRYLSVGSKGRISTRSREG